MDTSSPITGPAAATPPPLPRTPVPPYIAGRVPWKAVGIYVAISWGMLWVFALPFWWLPRGIADPLFTPVIAVGMLSPAIASLIVAKAIERTSWRTRVGLRFRGRWKALLVWTPLAALLVLAAHAIAAVIMVLRGVPGDLTGRSWAQLGAAQLSEAAGTEIGAGAAVTVMLVSMLVGILITAVPALGEEIGWRGWLWPALKPLGLPRAVALGGIIWSLWHLPIMLIGYNYPGAPRAAAIAMFLVPCIAMNLLFGAITERAKGNPIPAAFAHAALNAGLGTMLGIFSTQATAAQLNLFLDTALGLIGAIVIACLGVLVMPWGRIRAARERAR
ncbi:CPBP family intramembrane glutamic endopeptidase [Brachybacterium hainanense]|uniref:CPBP family intramembrane glutamic endopeptidase n=1 Tax=Brachybacterium hainanense TaxID=1541174 RepID=A0ABV6RC47_9MICO